MSMTEIKPKPEKPLGHKAYGSIPHLIGSRRGPGDIGVNIGQHRICTEKARDKHDVIIVQEKLDGSCVAVANIEGEIIPLIRAGYIASGSNYKQHHLFHDWAMKNRDRFQHLLVNGERVVGEWLAQAHGTKYDINIHSDPFVAFDIMRGQERIPFDEFKERTFNPECDIVIPATLHEGGPISIEDAMKILGEHGFHGAIDPVEGAVWRVERKGKVDYLAKFVKPSKGADGKYLESVTGEGPVWNWQPS